MKNANVAVHENKERLLYLIKTVKNLAESFGDRSGSHLGDYLTVDIATEWEKGLMDMSKKMFEDNFLTQKQFFACEEISKRFIRFSNSPFYEEKIWTLEGLKSHPFWEEQRKLAKEILDELEKIKL